MTVNLEKLHRFHSYSARFPSKIAEAAIAEYTSKGDSVCDPFCGSGTTLVAGLATGRNVVGIDIDVLAGIIPQLKCSLYSAESYARWLKQFLSKLDRRLRRIGDFWNGDRPQPGSMFAIGDLELYVPDFANLTYWFPPQVVVALAAISDLAHKCRDGGYERLILASLSASILAKWPKTLSYAMDVDHTRPHRRVQKISLRRVKDVFVERLNRSVKCLGDLNQIYSGVQNFDQLSSSVFCPHDARAMSPLVGAESQALVVTSPPYFNAVDYPRAHRLSVCWMNGHAPKDLVSRKKYVGLRYASEINTEEMLKRHPTLRRRIPKVVRDDPSLAKRVCAFFSDLDQVLAECWITLRPGGHGVFVIANNIIKEERLASHSALSDLARARGFNLISSIRRTIARLRRRFPVGQFGFDGPMTHEHVVVVKKPKKRTSKPG